MEVRHNVIGVVQSVVETCICQDNAGHAANGEQEDKTNRPQHRHFELDGAAPHCGDPREYLHPGGYGDHHCGRNKIGFQLNAHTDRVHVVRPHDKADETNGRHSVGHRQIAEHRLLGERRDNVRDNAETRQDHDVDFRVSKEPEQVLEHYRVAAACWVEELRTKVTVGQQHRQCAGKNRQSQKKQERRNQNRPGKQRHLVDGHARCAHVQDGHDEVDRTQNRGNTRDVQRQDQQVHRRTIVSD